MALVIAVVGVVLVARGQVRRAHDPLAQLLGDAADPQAEAASGSSDLFPSSTLHAVRRWLEVRLGKRLRAVGADRGAHHIERELLLAGLSNQVRADEVLAAQAIAAVAGGALGVGLGASGLLTGRLAVVTAVLLFAAGAILPRTMLRKRGVRRQAQVHARVSDGLDLLTLCLEAGLAFDAALAAVADAMPGPLGDELSRVVAEMGLGLSRSEALENLRTRNDSPAVDAFVVSLLQADALGTPVGRILAAHAVEARTRRRQEARERAGSLPVRILLPTVLLVFPPTFVILLGPAAMSIRGAF